MSACNYCEPKGEVVLWSGDRCRVIIAHEPGFRGWCRVAWHEHIRELSDLSNEDRGHVMDVVAGVERVLLAELKPVKMNIAALGTAMPHLHFHLIPRFADDATFPDPVWLPRRHQQVDPDGETTAARLRTALAAELGASNS